MKHLTLFFAKIVVLLPLLGNYLDAQDAQIHVIFSNPLETVIEIVLPETKKEQLAHVPYNMTGLETKEIVGYPSAPFVSGIVAVSEKGAFAGEIQQIEQYSEELNGSFSIEGLYPAERLVLDPPEILRDYRIIRFRFFPIQYDLSKQEVRTASRAIIRIRKCAQTGVNEKHFSRDRISACFYSLYKSSILNFSSVARFPSDSILYVIITPDQWYDDLMDFKDSKEEGGFIVKLVRFSDITLNPQSSDIRDYLYTAYTTWDHPPDYFLAVGDAGFFPVKYSIDYGNHSTYVNDNYYVALDYANDIFPDIFGGRLPVENTFQLETILNKVMNYEWSPYMAETIWYNQALMVSSDEYPSQPETKTWVREKFINYGYSSVDTIYARNYSSSQSMRTDIINISNQGSGFINYRGPGSPSNWHSERLGIILENSHIMTLNNGRKLPLVTSIGCGVGSFDHTPCFGELWLKLGTPTAEKGCVGFFGPTSGTNTRHNNKLDRGIYKGIFEEGLVSFGEATTRGKIYMYEICGMSDSTIKHMNEFLILGDPSLIFRTAVPESMLVTHNSVIPIGESILWVMVQDRNGPVKNAFVCAKMDSIFHITGKTDNTGTIGLRVFPTINDTVFISVIAQNHFPYKGFSLIDQSTAWPGYCSHSVDDDTFGTSYGNDDGICNLGESIELPVMLKNYGTQTVIGVTACISSNDIFVAIVDSHEVFGDIAAGDSLLSQDDFDIAVSALIPDKHNVLFKLEVNDANDSLWISHFKVKASCPQLEAVKFIVDDEGQCNPNGYLDPGETVNYTCRLLNRGSAEGQGVTAILQAKNSFINCLDSVSAYDTIPPNEEKDGTPFIIKAHPSTPHGYEAAMQLTCVSQRGYCDTLLFDIVVGVGGDYFIWDADPNHNSGPKIHTSLQAAGYRGDYSPSIQPLIDRMDAYKAIFICLGVYPNKWKLQPSELIDSLCLYLDRGGRIYMEGGDTWAADPPTALHTYFNINGIDDGECDINHCLGMDGAFTNQMDFFYVGDSWYIDRLETMGSSFSIFKNSYPEYIAGIAYDAIIYRAVGTSFEFGGLIDSMPPSTKEALADSIMRFFGISSGFEGKREKQYPKELSLSQNVPNPFRNYTRFDYAIPVGEFESGFVKKHVCLMVYDITGRRIKALVNERRKPGFYSVIWNGTDDNGKKTSQGIYFVRIAIENEKKHRSRKIILLR